MSVQLDHLILPINDREASVAFYTDIIGLTYEGERDPFSVIRVTPQLTLQLAPFGTSGGEHLAFAMSRPDFEAAFDRIKAAGLRYGDRFDSVGNMRGPGDEEGAQGTGKMVYVFDPNEHLIEIRHYEV